MQAWSTYLEHLKNSLEKNGWAGAWYQRGYFDDGTPLGSKINDDAKLIPLRNLGLLFLKWHLSNAKKQQWHQCLNTCAMKKAVLYVSSSHLLIKLLSNPVR